MVTKTFELRDYQIEGVDFLQKNKRAMLLDAPGMGKTAQATYAAVTPALVVCPAYLVPQWKKWLESQGFSVAAAVGSRFEREKILSDFSTDWLIVNYEMLNIFDQFATASWYRHWRTIIFDESHHLKSHSGKRSKVAVKLAARAEYVFMLTATPIKREIDDLFMQFRILQPSMFTSYWRFVNQFCIAESTYFGVQIKGAKQSTLPELHSLLSILSIGRSYEDVGRSLPPVIERYIPLRLDPRLQKVYDDAINYFRVLDEAGDLNFGNYMSAMHTLRQHLTGGLKAEIVKGIIEDEPKKSVIFSWYQNTAEEIARLVPDCTPITGLIKSSERRALALSSNHVSATISSLGEGTEGLQEVAKNIIFAEEDWTPGSNHQALTRVWRERQETDNEEPVVVTYIVVEKTIDEIVHQTAKGRALTAKEVVREAIYL